MKNKIFFTSLIFSLVFSQIGLLEFVYIAKAQTVVSRAIIFPVLGGGSYSDDFGAPRSGGRTHEGTDIMNKKMQPLLAAVNGTVSYITETEAGWGYALTIKDSEGFTYHYLHINNDTPGTDDGLGGYNNAFAPGIARGSKVVAGQTVAFMGDSGNAESTVTHLHFEIRMPDGTPINPYQSLKAAPVLSVAVAGSGSSGGATITPTPQTSPTVSATPKPSSTPAVTPTLSSGPVSYFTEIFPYDQFEGGATLALGNVDNDPELEVIIGTAFNGGGRTIVKIFEPDGKQIGSQFFAYGDSFRGGMSIAAADVDGDGKTEIITGAGPGGGPHIKVLKPSGQLLSEFMAYSSGFTGGVNVSAADVDGDGKTEIITGAGPGGGPHVRVFDVKGNLRKEFFAYAGNFFGGVDVAGFAGVNTGRGGIVTSPLAGGGPHIKIFDLDGKVQNEFMAFASSATHGVRIDSANLVSSSDGIEIVAAPATSGGAKQVKIFSSQGTEILNPAQPFSASYSGGFDVAAGSVGKVIMLSSYGNLRTTIKSVLGF